MTGDFQLTPPSVDLKRLGRLGTWHLPARKSLADLCAELDRRQVNYAVLATPGEMRRKERAPMLVADEHVRKIKGLITRAPLGQPLAVYSTTGLPNFSFQQHWRHNSDATNMAALPPYLAEALLARAGPSEQGYRVPTPRDMLLWAIYRALYLSGDEHFEARTGEPPILRGQAAADLRELAAAAGADLHEPLTLPALDGYLAEAGWEPPLEVVRRLSAWNSFAIAKLRAIEGDRPHDEPGFAAFFLRRETLNVGLQDKIAEVIETTGFELFKTIHLDDEQIAEVARAARGSNWGGGAMPVNGGPPVAVILAFDVAPTSISSDVRIRYPFLDNERILTAKLMCRQFIQDNVPRNKRFNPVHSVDDSAEAWRFVQMLVPEDEPALRELIAKRRADFATKYEVIRPLTRKAARAKIELIRFGDGVAVKKTFRHNCLRFLERETAFMDAISPHRPEILPVIERGPNYFITPFVVGKSLRRPLLGKSLPALMSLEQVRNAADLLRFLFERGYDPVDLAPHNLLVDKAGQLHAIDFEFVHHRDKPIKAERSACLNGITPEFSGDWPNTARWDPRRSTFIGDPYKERWFGYTGLSRESFLYGSPAKQRAQRLVNYPAYLASKAGRRFSAGLRARAKEQLKRALPALTRITSNKLRSRAT